MNELILSVIICIAILIIFYCYMTFVRPRVIRGARNRKLARIKNFDQQKTRDQIMRDAQGATLNADDLFTIAMIYLRAINDMQDMEQYAPQRTAQVAHRARRAMQEAIAARTRENQNRAPEEQHEQLFNTAIIIHRAHEILPDAEIPWVPHVARAEPMWNSDPENVHDSAVGRGVIEQIAVLRAADQHTCEQNTCIGSIIAIMRQRVDDEDKRNRILRVLGQAQKNNFCERYDINEMEALRLAYEYAYSAKTEEHKNNLHDAFLNALVECAPEETGTVCLVGRISRYVAAFDGIDEQITPVRPVDAYRAELFGIAGKMTAEKKSDEEIAKKINEMCDAWQSELPARTVEDLRNEAIAGIA